jgi:hypothetical protein
MIIHNIIEKFVISSNGPPNATPITSITNTVFMCIIISPYAIIGYVLYKRSGKQKDDVLIWKGQVDIVLHFQTPIV